MQSPDDRIFITYGAAHLPGLVAELRKLDPKWAVGSVKWLRGIENLSLRIDTIRRIQR